MESTGVLKNLSEPRVVDSLVVEATEAEMAAYEALPCINIDQMQAEYTQTIGEGWAFPLKKFMGEMELLESLQMQTVTDASGVPHMLSVPITQPLTNEEKAVCEGAKQVALKYNGKIIAVVNEPEIFANRKEEIVTRTFGTSSLKHPMGENILAQGDWLLSGASMHFTSHVMWNDGMDKYRMTPKQIQAAIKEKNADAVYAFQVRNPLHNGHVLLLKDTRVQLLKQGYKNPILLLHPLGGWCKDDDVPLDYRMK